MGSLPETNRLYLYLHHHAPCSLLIPPKNKLLTKMFETANHSVCPADIAAVYKGPLVQPSTYKGR